MLGAHDAALDDVIRIRYGSGDWPHADKLRLYPERIAPMASPEFAQGGGHWTERPCIARSGPRPRLEGLGIPLRYSHDFGPHLRFDTFL